MAKLGEVILRDALVGRPAAGTEGRLFYDTDNSLLYRDSGAVWESVEGGSLHASAITYTPAVNTDWDGDADPGDLDDAVDQLAERVDDLEGASVDAGDVSYTPAVNTDWDGDADPGDLDDALDQLAERIDDVEGGLDASVVTYTPTTPADWNSGTDPGDADDALDQLASRVTDLGGSFVVQSGELLYIIGDGETEISTGVQSGDLVVPYDCGLTAAMLLADQSGSIVVDVWCDDYDNYPPTNADTITGGNELTIAAATKSYDGTLADWTTSLTKLDILRFNVDSVTDITRLTIALLVERS